MSSKEEILAHAAKALLRSGWFDHGTGWHGVADAKARYNAAADAWTRDGNVPVTSGGDLYKCGECGVHAQADNVVRVDRTGRGLEHAEYICLDCRGDRTAPAHPESPRLIGVDLADGQDTTIVFHTPRTNK